MNREGVCGEVEYKEIDAKWNGKKSVHAKATLKFIYAIA